MKFDIISVIVGFNKRAVTFTLQANGTLSLRKTSGISYLETELIAWTK